MKRDPAAGSAQILFRGNLRVVGPITFGPDVAARPYHARFEKSDDGIVVWIDPVEKFESVAVEERGAFELERPPSVTENTSFEGATLEDVAIKLNDLIGEDVFHVIHESEAPVDGSTTTVAGRGEAASLSPEGRSSDPEITR